MPRSEAGVKSPKPVPLEPDLDAIPRELRQRRQWVIWRQATRGGRATKVPCQARPPHRMAKVNDPSTWGSFAEVVAAYTEGKGDGIGFVITADDPYCGIDLDSCVDPLTGEIDPWALEIIEVLDGYTELSPSRTGLHIIVQAKLPEGGRRKGSIEFYDRDRFFTMTGWVVHA